MIIKVKKKAFGKKVYKAKILKSILMFSIHTVFILFYLLYFMECVNLVIRM